MNNIIMNKLIINNMIMNYEQIIYEQITSTGGSFKWMKLTFFHTNNEIVLV